MHQFEHCSTDNAMASVCTENCENIKSLIIDRWHFRMLNDKVRNTCYEIGIMRCIADYRSRHNGRQPVVLDIGGGTGLLAMFAARFGVTDVYSCELSPYLCEIAAKCVRSNGFERCITIIPKHSGDIIVGRDIPTRADIIVTELMDAGLLGEHIIKALCDARERLLAPGGDILPFSATVYGVFVDCCELRHRQIMMTPDVPGRFPLAESAFAVLSMRDISLKGAHGTIRKKFVVDESYTCESMHLLVDRLTELSPVLEVGTVSLDGRSGASDIEPWRVSLSFNAVCSGSMDAFIYWFDLSTTEASPKGSGETATAFSTAPQNHRESALLGRAAGWDQAVLFLGHSEVEGSAHGFKQVLSSQSVSFDFYQNEERNLFHIEIKSVRDDCGFISDASSAGALDVRLGEQDIRLLNDWGRTEVFISAVLNAMDLIHVNDSKTVLNIIELNNSWLSFASVV